MICAGTITQNKWYFHESPDAIWDIHFINLFGVEANYSILFTVNNNIINVSDYFMYHYVQHSEILRSSQRKYFYILYGYGTKSYYFPMEH
jgi:hypothetical protein